MSRVESTRVKSRAKGKVESKVEVLKISLKVRKKTKTSAIRIMIILCFFFYFCAQKIDYNNNVVRVSNEMLCQSNCVSTLKIIIIRTNNVRV